MKYSDIRNKYLSDKKVIEDDDNSEKEPENEKEPEKKQPTYYDIRSKYGLNTSKVDQNYIDLYVSNANNFLKNAEKEYESIEWKNAVDSYNTKNLVWKSLEENASEIRTWLVSNKDYMDDETYLNFNAVLDDINSGGSTVMDAFRNAKDYYSQWETEDSYNQYKKKQERVAELESAKESEDFEQYSQTGRTIENPDWDDTFAPLDILGWTPFGDGDDINNMVTFAEANKNKAVEASAQAMRSAGRSTDKEVLVGLINEHMSDEEKAIYNYYIGKGDKEAADEYLDALTDEFIIRQGSALATSVENQGALAEVFFSATAGLESFLAGIGNLDNYIMGTEADPTTAIQYAYAETSKNNTGAFKVINDIGYTTGNMLPSVLIGTVSGGAGLATMGVSAGGNAYAEMRNLGYEDWQAAGYATLTAASEVLLQKALGGISNLGGKHSLSAATTKFVSGLDHALARVAIKVPLNMASEGLEEGIQTALEPVFKAMMTGEDYEAAEWEDIIYSALLGSLSAGVMEGVPTVVGEPIRSYKANKAFGSTNAQNALVNQGLEFAEGTEARGFAEKYKAKLDAGKSLNGTQLANLYEASEGQYITDDTAKLKKSILRKLGDLGETHDVTPIADVLVKYASGKKLSSSDIKILNNSDYGYKVLNGLNKGNIKSGGLSDKWAENIGTKRISPEAYGKGLNNGTSKIDAIKQISAQPPEKKSVEKTLENSKVEAGKVFKASESGKTIYVDQNGNAEDVSVNKIVSTDGGLKVELDSGKTVSASDLEFSSTEEALMYEMVARMEVAPETANQIISTFKPTDAKQATLYFASVPLAYQYGKMNYEAGLENISLSEQQKRLVYNRGRADAMVKAESKPKSTVPQNEKVDAPAKKNGIIYENGFTYDEATANELQKKSMIGIEVINKMSNLEVHVFESKVVNGKRVAYVKGKLVKAPNGYFTDGNKIYIDINAGNGGEGAMLYTMSHEVTHYIRKWNAKGFKELGDYLIEQYGKHGVPVNALLEAQKDKIEKRYKEEKKTLPSEAKLADMAYEELVADAMSDMFTDPKAYEKLAKLKQKNRSLWEKLGEAIKALLDKLKTALGIYKTKDVAVAQEAMFVRDLSTKVYEKLQDLYIKAFVEADANYEASIGSRNLSELAEAKNENGEPLFQYRAMEADEDTYRDMLQKWGKITDVQIDNLFATIDTAMELIKDNLEILDYAWDADIDDRAFSPVKPNSDKLYQVSLDFSTLCRKRILQQTVQAQLQEALNKPLTKEEGIAIRDALIALQEEGRQIEVACALCYVESARMKSPEQIKRFVENREKVIKEFFAGKSGGSMKARIAKAEADVRERLGVGNASLKSLPGKVANEIRDAKKAAKASYAPTAEEQKLIEAAKGMTVSDFTSPEGLEKLAKNYPLLFDAYTSYIRNATKSKGIENDTWWRAGDSMKIGDVLIANMNKENGLRSQSWSDFQVIHILDYIGATIELATRNAKEQAYSKVPDYVELMGNTGVMINMSLIPTATFNGTLDYDSVEGIDYKRALELRDKYHATAGTICIGVDDVQIKLLLADTTIDYVIPFHRSGMSAHIRKAMHIPTWSEYQDYQGESKLSRAEAEKRAKKYGVQLLDASDPNYQKGTSFSEWFDIKEAQQIAKIENANPTDKAKQKKYGVMYGGYMAMQNAANNYLKLCAERGLAPKFSHEKADFTAENNYWKLLIDRKMVDNVTGEVIEQQAIKPVFNQGEVMRILNDEVARYPKVKADQDYAIRTVTEKMLSGEIKGGMSAEAIAKVMKKPVDNVTNVNILASSEDTMLSDRDTYAPTFYSHMGTVIDGIRLDKMGANGVISYLKGKGVKDEEIKWSGIEAFLEGKKSVTKAELQEFVAGSQLRIEEEMSGYNREAYAELDALWLKHAGVSLSETFSDDFDLPLTEDNMADVFDDMEKDGYDVPSIEDQRHMLELAKKVGNEGRWARYKLGGGTNYRELVFKLPNSTYSNNAMRGHWGQDVEGVLAHARIQDFEVDGKRMLFVEEIQSDWHNEGREKGYTTKEYEDAVEAQDKLYNEYKKHDLAFHKYVRSNEFMTDPEDVRKKKHAWLRNKVEAADKKFREAEKVVDSLKEKGAGDTPDAPFKDTYHEYVLKRLLRMAAEEGYDSIGWTPADIQSKRWSEDYAEAYRIEYDQDIPKYLRKYGKKWGATVGKTSLKGDTEIWYMDISGSMKGAVLNEGQVLFCERDDTPNSFNPDGMTLKQQLQDALDTSQSFERRYVYVGEFTQEFIDKLKEHIDIKKYPIVMNYRDAYLSMEAKERGKYQGERISYHNLGVDGLESALMSFSTPEYVLLSTKNGKIELVLQGRDYKNRQLFSIVEVNTTAQSNKKYIDVHVVTSVYGNRGIQNRIITAGNEGRIIYKKEEESTQGMPQVQYKRDINENSSANRISQNSELVNSEFSEDDEMHSDRDTATSLTEADVEKSFEAIWDDIVESTHGKYKDVKDFLRNHTDYEEVDYWSGAYDAFDEDDLDAIPLNKVEGLWFDGSDNWEQKWTLGDVLEAYQNGTLDKFKYRANVESQTETTPQTWQEEARTYYTEIYDQLSDNLKMRMPSFEDVLSFDYENSDWGHLTPAESLILLTHEESNRTKRKSLMKLAYMLTDMMKHHKLIFDYSIDHYSDRDPNTVSNRTLLANALESIAENDIEKNKLKQYKDKIALIESEQKKLAEIRAKANELRFTKGRTPSETKQMRDLDFDARQIENRINTYDKQLLNLESTSALKKVLEREKAMLRKKLEKKGKEALSAYKERAAKTQRELMTRYQESRKNAVESRNKTAMRHKIKGVVSDLNKLLLNPTKEQHVPIGLQKVVAEALDAINMDTMNAKERVAYYNDLISKSTDPNEIEMLTKKRDFFEYRDMNFKDRITALKNAYVEFKESDDPLIRNAHNEAIENLIKNTADAVGNKSLKDMSLEQLESVYDMYKAILATVRNSNKMFKEGRQATITENSEAVKTEVKEVGGHHDRIRKATKGIKSFTWNLLKPIYALQRIGSNTLTSLYENVRSGEETYASDIYEAREFYQDKSKTYNYDSWDFKKRYSFKDSAGNDFALSLDQILSLYAYSKREQADKHLEFGGFVFDDAIEVTEKNKLGIPIKYEVNDATPYRLRVEDLATVIASLTNEQKAFVDEMQTYLSEVMGEKGNEISLAMYDIKMFKEKHYFPLKTSRYFREYNPEQTGNPMLRNSGFTKKTVPKAGNPIVLSNFMDVWTSHVNDMSMYHSFVLPLEDFMRVYNYSSTAGGYDSVQQYIKNAYGTEANKYIEQLMQDINGGVISGNLPNGWLKMFGKFKKAAVAASLSTIVQQPTAVIRAMAIINPKYFAGIPFKGGHKKTWEEIKKYAPVAIIKEMGGFDVGSGRQAKDFITSQSYKGFGKIKGFFTDSSYRDSVFMWGATKADELGWNSIWKAVKREVASKQNLKPGTEEFFKACGKRFTEVVTQTQVYDSVFSRSGKMRDKGDLNKFATSFMGEPTTSFNMIYNAILRAKRGGSKAQAIREISSVYVSIVSAAAMASLVYALRDDDEDEAYLEKWAEAFGNKLSSEIWIHNMIPYIRDIASILEGWDVERPDMSIFSDIKSSFDQLFTINDDGEFEWKVDFSDPKSVYSAIENFGGSIASAFGLPLKNLMRDTRGIFNGFEAIFDDIHPTDIGGAFVEGFTGGKKEKSDSLYEAIISGDEGRLKIYREGYKTEDSFETAVRKALRENDPRIKTAAQARYDGDISEYTRIAKEIIAEGNFSQDTVVGAINSEITAIKKGEATEDKPSEDKDEATSIYSTSDINAAFESGDNSTALKIIDDLIKTKVANGKTEKEAKSSLRSSMTTYWKPLYKKAYQSGNSSEMARIRRILYSSNLYGSSNDVVKTCQNWLKD